MLYHEALVADIRRKYKNARNEKDKQTVAKVTVGKIVRKYRLQRWSEKALEFSRKRRTLLKNEDLSNSARKSYNRYADKSMECKVKTFFTRDDVSRMTTGKKKTITRQKIKMQKRFLVDTMKNLHRKYLAENNMTHISYAAFCRLRPFWVVHPSLSDCDTCQCKLHENLGFLAEKLCQLKLIETSNLESLTELVCCDIGSKVCMYGECGDCKDTTVPLSNSYDGAQKVTYMQWATEEKAKSNDEESSFAKITVKQMVESIQEELAERFHTHLTKFKRHLFNIRQQYAYYRGLHSSMANDECLIHIDFSENFSCKYSNEIQSVHFGSSHQQATLHTGVIYVGGNQEPTCFTSISPSKHKSPAAIWEHLKPAMDYVQTTYPEVSVVHFFSDGPCTQYRQKGNFFLFSTELAKRGLRGTWNFFESSHGKGAPDGVGAALKRTADVLISHGRDIHNAHELFKALSETNTLIKLFFVEGEAVEQALKRMPSNITAVPGTMRIHQVVTLAPGEITSRDVSCMCSTYGKKLQCECWNTQHFSFVKKVQATLLQGKKQINWDDPEVIGQWCVLTYDKALYPGIIIATDKTDVRVKCMHHAGLTKNRFFWPRQEDVLWYPFDDVLELIPPPQPVTVRDARHMQIQKEIWDRLSE